MKKIGGRKRTLKGKNQKGGNLFGNLFEMLEKTGWKRNSVLYFGDHIYGDLGNIFSNNLYVKKDLNYFF